MNKFASKVYYTAFYLKVAPLMYLLPPKLAYSDNGYSCDGQSMELVQITIHTSTNKQAQTQTRLNCLHSRRQMTVREIRISPVPSLMTHECFDFLVDGCVVVATSESIEIGYVTLPSKTIRFATSFGGIERTCKR